MLYDERVLNMKKYIIVISLAILTSCTRKIGADFDLIENYIDNEKTQLAEENLSVEHSMDLHKNKDIQKDTKTKNQLSHNHKPNNKKVQEQDKPQTNTEEKLTYGDIEHEDSMIFFKVLDHIYDQTKDKDSSGYITKGQNGIKRKEVRKVYVNDKYSHTETVKDTYTLKEPTHEQKWIGTKEKPPEPEKKPKPPKEEVSKPKDKMVIDGETWYLYKL